MVAGRGDQVGDRFGGREGEGRQGGVRVALHGILARSPRSIRTAEGWEVASLLLGSGDARRLGEGCVLVVCAGAGSSGAVARLAVGAEVIAVGRLVPRRAARPEDDAIELLADAVLDRRGPVSATAAPEPRIAP